MGRDSSPTNGFFKNIIYILSSNGVVLVCGFFSGIVTSRWLGPHDRGLLALVNAIPATVWMLSSFGINQASVYYIGKKKYQLSEIISNAFIIPFTLGITISLFLWFSKDVFILAYLETIKPFYLLLSILLIPIFMLTNSYSGVLRGTENFSFMSRLQGLISILGLTLSSSLLIVFGFGLRELIFSIIFLKTTELCLTLKKINRIEKIRWNFNLSLFKDSVNFGVRSYLQNMIGFLHNKIDLFMIAFFLLPAQVAIYDISVILGEMLLFLPRAITTVILPKMVKISEKEKIDIALKTGRLTIAIIAGLSVFLIFVGDFFIFMVYGTEYSDAFLPLSLLMPGIIFSSLNSVTVPYFTSKHKQQITILISIVSLMLNVLINITLIPAYGVQGAAISTSITYSLFSISMVLVFCRQTNSSFCRIVFIQKEDLVLMKSFLAKFYVKIFPY